MHYFTPTIFIPVTVLEVPTLKIVYIWFPFFDWNFRDECYSPKMYKFLSRKEPLQVRDKNTQPIVLFANGHPICLTLSILVLYCMCYSFKNKHNNLIGEMRARSEPPWSFAVAVSGETENIYKGIRCLHKYSKEWNAAERMTSLSSTDHQ